VKCGLSRRARLPAAYACPAFYLWSVQLVYALLLKFHRTQIHSAQPGAGDSLLLLASDFFFQLALIALGYGVLVLFCAVGRAWIGFVLAQLCSVAVVLVDTSAHGFFVATGQSVDYGLFVFTLSRIVETIGVLDDESTPWLKGLAYGMPASQVVVPWVLHFWLRGRARVAEGLAGEAASGTRPRARSIAWALLGFALAGGLGFAALWPTLSPTVSPTLSPYDPSFVRAPVLHLMVGALERTGRKRLVIGHADEPRATGAVSIEHRGGRRPNLVVIILESTTAKATTPYAEPLATTPSLAELASQGLVVDRAYAVVPHTSKALVAILCGFEPRASLEVVEASKGGMPGRCLADLLREQGYETFYIQAPTQRYENRRGLTNNMGFDDFFSGDMNRLGGYARVNYFGFEDRVMLFPSRRWLEERQATRPEKPFFVTYLTNASHSKYQVPPSFESKAFVTSGPQKAMRNLYYNSVHYVDEIVGEIIDDYREAGLFDDTVFLVVGDHGEGMWEHGQRGHDDIMYEEGLRVPLVLKAAGPSPPTGRIPGPLSQLAIVPTLLDALGFDVSEGEYEGESFLPGEGGDGGEDESRDETGEKREEKGEERGGEKDESVVYASCYRANHCAALIRGDRKIVYYFANGRTELFDLSTDPEEAHNLAEEEPELVRRWVQEILDWGAAVGLAHAQSEARVLGFFVKKNPPDELDVQLSLMFGDYFELLGHRHPRRIRRDTNFTFPFFYRVLKPVPVGYRIRMHGKEAGRDHVFDHVPVRGLYPLTQWKPGDFVSDLHRIEMPVFWKTNEIEFCIELLDEADTAVPIIDASGKVTRCHPLGRYPVRLRKGG